MSINLYMMDDLLGKQRVRRRSKYSFLNNNNNGRSARYGGGFIGQIRQKPAKSGRKRKYRSGIFKGIFSLPSVFRKRERCADSDAVREIYSKPVKKASGGGFSFPVPSLMTLSVIAGILMVSLIALNWQGLSLPSSNSLDPAPDELADRNLASYAMNIVPQTPEPQEDVSLDLTETFEWSSYKVKKGDSVYQIAANFGISMDAIIASNDISNAKRLREGEILRIPNMDGIPYTVKKGDSLSKISSSLKVPLEVILDVNDIRSDTIYIGQNLFIPGARMAPEALKMSLGELFIYPIRKNISSGYGWRPDPFTGEQRFHNALDIKGNMGTPVKAAIDGTVAALISDSRDFGNYIILKHDNGYRTVYAHLSAFSVKLGDKVAQGAKIGEVGSTGRSTGPHLHFQVYKDGRVINPLDVLP